MAASRRDKMAGTRDKIAAFSDTETSEITDFIQ